MAEESETVEIPRSRLALYERGLNILNKLWDDGEVGMTVKKRAKALDPSIRVPEIDVAEPLIKPLTDRLTAAEAENKKLRDEIEADKKARREAEEEGKFLSTFQDVSKRYGLTEDGQKEVADLMRKRGIADPEAAAALWQKNQPRPAPVGGSSFAPASMNLFGTDGGSEDERVKLLHSKPLAFFDTVVAEVLAEGDQAA